MSNSPLSSLFTPSYGGSRGERGGEGERGRGERLREGGEGERGEGRGERLRGRGEGERGEGRGERGEIKGEGREGEREKGKCSVLLPWLNSHEYSTN